MITRFETYGTDWRHYDMYGLSTDTKPTDCGNACSFYEMDTKKIFLFDEQNKVWLEQ